MENKNNEPKPFVVNDSTLDIPKGVEASDDQVEKVNENRRREGLVWGFMKWSDFDKMIDEELPNTNYGEARKKLREDSNS